MENLWSVPEDQHFSNVTILILKWSCKMFYEKVGKQIKKDWKSQ